MQWSSDYFQICSSQSFLELCATASTLLSLSRLKAYDDELKVILLKIKQCMGRVVKKFFLSELKAT